MVALDAKVPFDRFGKELRFVLINVPFISLLQISLVSAFSSFRQTQCAGA